MAEEKTTSSSSYSGKIDNASTIGGSISNKKAYSGTMRGTTLINSEGYDGVETDTTTTTVSNVKHTIAVDVNTKVIATKKFVSSTFETQADAATTAAQLDNKINVTKDNLQAEMENGLNELEESTTNAINRTKSEQATVNSEINARIDNLATDTSEFVENLHNELSNDIDSAKTELRGDIQALSEDMASADASINSSISTLRSDTNTAISSARQAASDAVNSAKTELTVQIVELSSTQADFARDLSSKDTIIAEHAAELGNHTSAISSNTSAIADNTLAIADNAANISSLESTVEANKTAAEEATAQLGSDLSAEIEQAKTDLGQDITDLSASLDTTNSNVTALGTSITNLDSKIQNDLTVLHEQITAEIAASIPHSDYRKHANEQSDITWEVIDGTQIIFTNEVTSLNLIVPQSIKYGSISMVTLVNMKDNKNITISNRSEFNTRIVTGTTRVPGISYSTAISGKKIIFTRCDGIDVEILIIEEQED